MGQSSSKIREMLVLAARDLRRRPDLSEKDVQWLERFALRLVTEFSVAKSEAEIPKAA